MSGLPEYLRGAADMHVHSSPDRVPRRLDDIDVAREAAHAGFGAILLKNDSVPTMDRAYLVNRIVPNISVYGGIILNDSVGGFNPAAVRVALELGARVVEMPTTAAHNHKLAEGGHGGLSVFDAHGELRHDVKDICILVAHSQAILSTGHLSPEEGAALIRYAYTQGLRRMIVAHPEWGPTRYPIDLQRDLARYSVQFERHFASLTAHGGEVALEAIARAVADVGPDSTILASGLGQLENPAPAEGMALFARRMQAAGFSEENLRTMMVGNPNHLLE
jgi:hypothetical protein